MTSSCTFLLYSRRMCYETLISRRSRELSRVTLSFVPRSAELREEVFACRRGRLGLIGHAHWPRRAVKRINVRACSRFGKRAVIVISLSTNG
jgi:hypothetical protein